MYSPPQPPKPTPPAAPAAPSCRTRSNAWNVTRCRNRCGTSRPRTSRTTPSAAAATIPTPRQPPPGRSRAARRPDAMRAPTPSRRCIADSPGATSSRRAAPATRPTPGRRVGRDARAVIRGFEIQRCRCGPPAQRTRHRTTRDRFRLRTQRRPASCPQHGPPSVRQERCMRRIMPGGYKGDAPHAPRRNSSP